MAIDVKSLQGNEITDDYVREAPARGRWGETWDTFKRSFGKIVLINLFMIIFLLPSVVILFLRSMYIAGLGMQYPFNSNTGIGYPAYPGMEGLTESLYLSTDLLFYAALFVGGLIAAVGISGGAYSIRKLVNTHGKFKLKDFFHGVKVGYFNTVLPITLFLMFFYSCVIVGDWKDLAIARGSTAAGPVTAYVFVIIATVIVGIYCAWLFAAGVSYRLKFGQLFKNAFMLILASPVHTLFFAGFALIPVWLYLIGTVTFFVQIIAYVVLILFGLSFILLVWLTFTQWVFDLYVTPTLKAAEEEARAKKSPKQLAEEQEEDDKRVARELLAAGKSELIGKPILPIDKEAVTAPLGKTYNRADLNRVSEDKAKLGGRIADYEKQHINDPLYAEYNKLFAEREKALQQPEGKKNKKKKVSSDNLLK